MISPKKDISQTNGLLIGVRMGVNVGIFRQAEKKTAKKELPLPV